MNHCSEHSGFDQKLKNIDENIKEIKQSQEDTRVDVNFIRQQLSDMKVMHEVERNEVKWRNRTTAGVWGVTGGAATYILTKILGKII